MTITKAAMDGSSRKLYQVTVGFGSKCKEWFCLLNPTLCYYVCICWICELGQYLLIWALTYWASTMQSLSECHKHNRVLSCVSSSLCPDECVSLFVLLKSRVTWSHLARQIIGLLEGTKFNNSLIGLMNSKLWVFTNLLPRTSLICSTPSSPCNDDFMFFPLCYKLGFFLGSF